MNARDAIAEQSVASGLTFLFPALFWASTALGRKLSCGDEEQLVVGFILVGFVLSFPLRWAQAQEFYEVAAYAIFLAWVSYLGIPVWFAKRESRVLTLALAISGLALVNDWTLLAALLSGIGVLALATGQTYPDDQQVSRYREVVSIALALVLSGTALRAGNGVAAAAVVLASVMAWWLSRTFRW